VLSPIRARRIKKTIFDPARGISRSHQRSLSGFGSRTGDYVRKNRFQRVVLGLSGGIDSSLTAAIAVDALGKEGVVGVLCVRYSSSESMEDARDLAENLGIEFHVIPIQEIFESYLTTLRNPFAGKRPDVTEEKPPGSNSRQPAHGAFQQFDWLVLTTGNKSEMSVGYCTLYGDMAGGFAVIKDVLNLGV